MGETDLGRRVVPSLLVSDMSETLSFYAALGFEKTGSWGEGDQESWAEVTRDGVVLQLYTDAPVGTPATPVFSGTLYFFPSSVTGLAEEWRGRVPFAWGPEEMPYGMREFAVRDPNGYFLAFTEPA